METYESVFGTPPIRTPQEQAKYLKLYELAVSLFEVLRHDPTVLEVLKDIATTYLVRHGR